MIRKLCPDWWREESIVYLFILFRNYIFAVWVSKPFAVILKLFGYCLWALQVGIFENFDFWKRWQFLVDLWLCLFDLIVFLILGCTLVSSLILERFAFLTCKTMSFIFQITNVEVFILFSLGLIQIPNTWAVAFRRMKVWFKQILNYGCLFCYLCCKHRIALGEDNEFGIFLHVQNFSISFLFFCKLDFLIYATENVHIYHFVCNLRLCWLVSLHLCRSSWLLLSEIL